MMKCVLIQEYVHMLYNNIIIYVFVYAHTQTLSPLVPLRPCAPGTPIGPLTPLFPC